MEFGEYLTIAVVVVVGIIALALIIFGESLSPTVYLDSDGDLNSAIKTFDFNNNILSIEHLALAENQQVILNEIQELNLFSQCVIDTENIVAREVPIDEFGGFRRVSIVTLVCPELN